MRVVVANGTLGRLSIAYWADDAFMAEFPNAVWAWNDGGHKIYNSSNGKRIIEDITGTFLEFEK